MKFKGAAVFKLITFCNKDLLLNLCNFQREHKNTDTHTLCTDEEIYFTTFIEAHQFSRNKK